MISVNLVLNLRNPFANSAQYVKFYHLWVWMYSLSTTLFMILMDYKYGGSEFIYEKAYLKVWSEKLVMEPVGLTRITLIINYPFLFLLYSIFVLRLLRLCTPVSEWSRQAASQRTAPTTKLQEDWWSEWLHLWLFLSLAGPDPLCTGCSF